MRKPGVCALATLLVALGSPIALGPATLSAQPPSRRATPPAGADRITESQLRGYLGFIASDLLEGRATPSRGQDLAAAFVAAHLERLGLTPAGDNGTYFQRVALTRRAPDPAATTFAIGGRALTGGDDYLAGEQPGHAEAGVVYVGNGTVLAARALDPYKGLDVRGKFVVSHWGLPAGVSRADLKGTQGVDWETTEAAARKRGAAGVLYLPDFALLQEWSSQRERRRARPSLTVDAFTEADQAPLPTAILGARAVSMLFGGETLTGEEAWQRAQRRDPATPFALAESKRVSLTIVTRDEALVANNIVAVLEGRDPVLKREHVAFGAHYDHLGTATAPNDGDAIFNGADDDGSGTVGLLAMAEAFAQTRPRPKRSLLFVWHTGEERGLWGARYFTDHPTVPLDHIVAQLNVDMIGRGREAAETATGPLALTDMNSVYVVGSRRISRELGDLLTRVNSAYHQLRFDYALDAPDDPARIYERSDHYHYAKHGIPIAFFFTGVHPDYHGVNDELDDIDFPKYQRIVQTIYAAGRALADAATRPRPTGTTP